MSYYQRFCQILLAWHENKSYSQIPKSKEISKKSFSIWLRRALQKWREKSMTLERNGDEEVHLDELFYLSWPERLSWSRRGWPLALSTAESSARPTINRPGSFTGQLSSNLGSTKRPLILFIECGEFYVTVDFFWSPGEIHQTLVQTNIFNLLTFYNQFVRKKLGFCWIILRENWSSIFQI